MIQNSNLEHALKYLKLSCSVIPIKPNSKEPQISWKEYQSQRPTEQDVREWWQRYPKANIGIVTGDVSGLCVLDIDDMSIMDRLEMPGTVTAFSGGKGLPHYYFKYANEIPSFSHCQDGRELMSFRSDGKYIIAPPSVHFSGGCYTWAEGQSLGELELAEPPDCLFEYAGEALQKKLDRELSYSGEDSESRRVAKQVKERITFSKLLQDLGYEGENRGRYWMFKCPFHEDGEHPDFRVLDNICGAVDSHDDEGYDPIKFLMELRGCSFKQALEFLRDYIGDDTEITKKASTATKIVNLVLDSDVTLFHDEHGEAYARYPQNNRYEINIITGDRFMDWVTKEWWSRTGSAPDCASLKSATKTLRAKGRYQGDEYHLHVRVAEHESKYWYDLGDGRAVSIDRSGWLIVDDPPILFKNFSHRMKQVEPEQSDLKGIYKVFDYVRITDEALRLVYLANLVTSLIPDIPHPIDNFSGPAGACKTTASKVKKVLLDPSYMENMNPHKNMTEFIQRASHHWVITLENLSSIPESLSDALCRFVTGDGFSKRKLYTDDEDFVYSLKRCLSINGINLVAEKADLLDRSLIYELEPVDDRDRKEEKELWAQFEEDKPKLLGALFSLLSRSMAEYARVKVQSLPRMADFAHWGCAVARALGKPERDFMSAYYNNIGIQNEEALEASQTAQCIRLLMKQMRMWEGSPSELFHKLNTITYAHDIDKQHESYPTAPNMLWKKIMEVIPNLKEAGIQCKKGKDSGGRKITIINHRFDDIQAEPGEQREKVTAESGNGRLDMEELSRMLDS